MAFQHVIFDCDGVLVDSEAISMAVDQRMLAKFDIHLSHLELHERFVGLTFEMMQDSLEAEYGRKLPADLTVQKEVLMAEAYEKELQAVAGVKEMLGKLHLPHSIATNGPRVRALAALNFTGLRPFFGDRVTTYEDVREGKPAPDIYLLAAKRAGVDPASCVVVEDSQVGATAALKAGCRVIGFNGAAFDKIENYKGLQQLGVPIIINDMAELIPTISRL